VSNPGMKRVLSWVVWSVGIGLSVIAFAALGVRRWPWPEGSSDARLEFVGFGLCSVVMLVASVFALRRRRWAGVLLIAGSLPVAALFLMSAGSYITLKQRLAVPAVVAATLCVPGAFWALTARLKWPSLMSSVRRNRRTIVLVGFGVGLYALAVVGAVTFFVLNGPEPVGDCGGISSLRARPLYPTHCVFTARTVRIGRRQSWDRDKGLWALTLVEQSFWGAPKYAVGYVVVFGGFFGEREEWLFDAFRYDGIISGRLPIVQTLRCGRSRTVQTADADIRVLQDRQRWKGGRIIGTALKGRLTRAAGANIVIIGPAGRTETTTDAQGIYDVSGMPPGRYSIQAQSPDPERLDWDEQFDVKDGEVWGREVYVK
jgi:hypothetical protein